MSNTPITFEAQKVAQYLAAQSEASHEAFLDTRLREVHTALPAIVQSYDPVKKTLEAQPAIMRVLDSGPIPLPLCVDVPVHFAGGGGFTDTYPIAQGDECWLMFSERAIDAFWQSGAISMPSEFRMHDLSDGFAFVGNFSQPKTANFTPGTSAKETWFNGTKIFSIDSAGNVTIAGALTVTGEVTGNGKALSAHTHGIATAPQNGSLIANLSSGNVAGVTAVPT
jgi:hypothetical protein